MAADTRNDNENSHVHKTVLCLSFLNVIDVILYVIDIGLKCEEC